LKLSLLKLLELDSIEKRKKKKEENWTISI